MMILLSLEDSCGDHMNTVRKAIESMYKDTCNVYEQKKVTDPITHSSKFEEVLVHANKKCKLSFSTVTVTGNQEAATKAQTVKLFIAPELEIQAGSKISVTHQGRTIDYKRSGEPAVYSNHQEIMLDLFERYA